MGTKLTAGLVDLGGSSLVEELLLGTTTSLRREVTLVPFSKTGSGKDVWVASSDFSCGANASVSSGSGISGCSGSGGGGNIAEGAGIDKGAMLRRTTLTDGCAVRSLYCEGETEREAGEKED
eukprot:Protomagalhaensia_sp_Gyna_25__4425@NODE_403_length_3553_cov_19_048662_g309_i0_p4_GENE_NODE_403_length_3553_cov_19_048662_g309_i0NODE_403_length_3553_cov_19_048662_g309_i0_p4_ORF_typecomplete_len122_score13_87C6/PF01681_17/9_5e02C6/PF01681_17/0_13_NODE_403_length_3553_cov_19_048662_g309_i026983063